MLLPCCNVQTSQMHIFLSAPLKEFLPELELVHDRTQGCTHLTLEEDTCSMRVCMYVCMRSSLLFSLRRPLAVVPSLKGRAGRGSTLLWGMMLSMLKVRLDPPGLSWDMGVKSVSSSPSSSCTHHAAVWSETSQKTCFPRPAGSAGS